MTVAGIPRATRSVPAGRSGRAATAATAIAATATTHRHGSPSSFDSDTASAAAAVSTDQPTRLTLHATDGIALHLVAYAQDRRHHHRRRREAGARSRRGTPSAS